MKYVLHPEAHAQLAEAVEYYTQIEHELGIRFYRDMERLLRTVCADPQRFRKCDSPARPPLLQRAFPLCSYLFGEGWARLDRRRRAHETPALLLEGSRRLDRVPRRQNTATGRIGS